ncbi:MAG: dockerin type I repeat-containing protein, partial [Clostridia bacterium]|nr:dockerin type I repeat-containing protein [Clostridia bacterium]
MRKVVAFALAMVTLLTMLVLPISAAEETEATVGEGVYGTDWVKYGDLDNNETIDAKDALAVLKYAVEKIEFSEVQEIVADVTKDTAVDAKDALDILKFA